jgi:hypothetical protein
MPAYSVDKSEILKSFKKPLTMVRGKKYTFNIAAAADELDHPFYITTDASGGPGMPGVVTENVEHSYERYPSPEFISSDSSIVITNNNMHYDSASNHYEVNSAVAGTTPTVTFRLSSDYARLSVGQPYLIKYKAYIGSGSLRVSCGITSGTLRSTAGTSTYSEVLVMASTSQFRDIVFKASDDFTGNIQSLSIKKVGIAKGTYVFTPSYEHPDVLYYMCGSHKDMGGKINLINAPGAILNDLEWYYTLGINQTNRTYPPTTSSDPAIVNKFLTGGLPAGLYKNVYNLPPSGVLYADRTSNDYYDAKNGDDQVSLSGLISDPEDDTLKYKWRHFSPKTTLVGGSLLTSFLDDESLTTTATLVVPPTDMIYTLHLEVHDSDNITTIPINVKVSGTIDFDDWDVGVSGINTFDLGDSNVPFDDLD